MVPSEVLSLVSLVQILLSRLTGDLRVDSFAESAASACSDGTQSQRAAADPSGKYVSATNKVAVCIFADRYDK